MARTEVRSLQNLLTSSSSDSDCPDTPREEEEDDVSRNVAYCPHFIHPPPRGHEFKGVRRRKCSFISEIRDSSGKRIWLGSHKSAELAAAVYDEAARILHGRHAFLNFPARILHGRHAFLNFPAAAPSPEVLSFEMKANLRKHRRLVSDVAELPSLLRRPPPPRLLGEESMTCASPDGMYFMFTVINEAHPCYRSPVPEGEPHEKLPPSFSRDSEAGPPPPSGSTDVDRTSREEGNANGSGVKSDGDMVLVTLLPLNTAGSQPKRTRAADVARSADLSSPSSSPSAANVGRGEASVRPEAGVPASSQNVPLALATWKPTSQEYSKGQPSPAVDAPHELWVQSTSAGGSATSAAEDPLSSPASSHHLRGEASAAPSSCADSPCRPYLGLLRASAERDENDFPPDTTRQKTKSAFHAYKPSEGASPLLPLLLELAPLGQSRAPSCDVSKQLPLATPLPKALGKTSTGSMYGAVELSLSLCP